MTTTPHLPVELLGTAAQDPTEPVDNALWRIAVVGHGVVKSATTTAPPGSPADGDLYIVPSGASGLWSGQTNKLAAWDAAGSTWVFITPWKGMTRYVDDAGVFKYWAGSGYNTWSASGIANIQADTSPVLGGDIDFNNKRFRNARVERVHFGESSRTYDNYNAYCYAGSNECIFTLLATSARGKSFVAYHSQTAGSIKFVPASGAQIDSDTHGEALSAVKTMGVRKRIVWEVHDNADGSSAVWHAAGYHVRA